MSPPLLMVEYLARPCDKTGRSRCSGDIFMADIHKALVQVDRYSPAIRLIELGLALSETRGGLTLDEMAKHLGVSRRTAERLRNTLDRVTGGLIATLTDEGHKRWKLPTAKFSAFTTPTLEELAELKLAAKRKRQEGSAPEAERLEVLALKLENVLPRSTLRRYEPDLDGLLEGTGVVARPGPKALINPEITDSLRAALLSMQQVRLTYRRRDTGEVSRPRVYPYGFLTGSRLYLVGFNPHPKVLEYRLYVLANIDAVEVLDRAYERDPSFDLQSYSTRSFGTYWDGEMYDVEWRFKPEVAGDARQFRFHPSQVLTDQPDGSVVVTFCASGLTEMVWHLFTWGDGVEIVRPQALKNRYREWIGYALGALSDDAPLRSIE
jgi:predicted DNA-binding transcriptional regulator YafY